MNKFLLLAGVAVIGFGAVSYSYATEEAHKEHAHEEHAHDDDHEAEHYEAIEIDSTEEAFKVLDEKTAAIGKVLQKEGELEFLELEEIHEITYSLEAAIDKIRADKAAEETAIDKVDEAIQAVHYASENQEEEKVRNWFAKLEPATGDLKLILKDPKPVKQDSYTIVIKNHKFNPAEIVVPAGEKIKLIIDNQDPTPEEFESHDMNREKIIGGNKKAKIFVGPLKPGKYHFFGEFNMDTANGYIIAK